MFDILTTNMQQEFIYFTGILGYSYSLYLRVSFGTKFTKTMIFI